MREGHQIFIIAKPKGQRYRSLVSTYHPSLDVTEALSTCHRLLRIFSDQANSTAIQQELALAADFFGNAHKSEIKALGTRKRRGKPESAAPCPFPFIATCLIVGASWNPDVGHCTPMLVEPFGIRYNWRHKGSDITILDITDLSDVRYCFLNLVWMESKRELPLYTPLDEWTYMSAFYHHDNHTVIRLDKYALVESAALAECWPEGDWQTTAAAGNTNSGLARGETNKQRVPSLRSLCQAKLFQELLSSDSPPDMELLDTPMLFSGFARDLQRFLTENVGALCKSPGAVEILKKAFASEKHFDFTLFHKKLAADDLIALASSDAMRDIKTANLSGFDAETDTRTAVGIVEHLKLDSLYLLSRPNKSTGDPSEMLVALTTASNHPLVRQKLVLGPAFSRGILSSQDLQEDNLFPRPPIAVDPTYWKAFPVVQLLYRGPWDLMPRDLQPRLMDFFLGDAFLNPVRFVTGLLNVIIFTTRALFLPRPLSQSLDVPLMFSCAPSSFEALTSATEVGPIPAEAFAHGMRMHYWGFDKKAPIRNLDPEGWTAVMVHIATRDPETCGQMRAKTRFRVALVRSQNRPIPFRDCTITPEQLEVINLKGFLGLATPEHICDFERCLSELTAWARTDGELVSQLGVDEVAETLQAFVDRTRHRYDSY